MSSPGLLSQLHLILLDIAQHPASFKGTNTHTKLPANRQKGPNPNITMKYIVVAALISAVLAAPKGVEDRQVPYVPCSGLYASAQCCATDVLGVANLDCGQPPTTPTDAASFSATCASIGQRARCCVLPIVSPDHTREKAQDLTFKPANSLTRLCSARPPLAWIPRSLVINDTVSPATSRQARGMPVWAISG